MDNNNQGSLLKEWVKMHFRGRQQDFIDLSGMSKSKIYNLFNQATIDDHDKKLILEAMEGIETGKKEELISILKNDTISQKNKHGNNYQNATHNEGSDEKIRELELKIAQLEGENKTLKEMIKLLTKNP